MYIVHLHLEYRIQFCLLHLIKNTGDVKTYPKMIKGTEELGYN